MRMKSFFAPTVQDAVELARVEMGPDALLVNSRKSPPEAQGLGQYEVVFARRRRGATTGGAGRYGRPGVARTGTAPHANR